MIKAEIGLLQDVSIQSAAGDNVIVLASMFPSTCDRLVMQLVDANGEIASLGAEVVRTAPVLQFGIVQFRVELRVNGFSDAVRRDPRPSLR